MNVMKKVKITLTSGNVVEKPVITAFKGTYGDYVVLDNESVGSMGLPVILISKIQDNKLLTIADANEWNAVKDNLRNIIAGNQIISTPVGEEYTGDDVYYKQLTLPVASFDALKATLADNAPAVADAAPANIAPVEPVAPTAPVAPAMPEAPAASPMPEVSSVGPMPVEPTPVEPVAPAAPVMPEAPVVGPEMPTPDPVPVEPVAPAAPVAPEVPESPVSPVMPEPVVEPIPAPEKPAAPVDIAADKEAFLKACENMFDALVAKFNK